MKSDRKVLQDILVQRFREIDYHQLSARECTQEDRAFIDSLAKRSGRVMARVQLG